MSPWSEPRRRTPFAPRKGGGHAEAVERLKDLTRERFALSANDTVIVAEEPTALPGFPPLATLVAFWTADGKRHHFRVFKEARAVTPADIPPAWLRDSLAKAQGIECSCC